MINTSKMEKAATLLFMDGMSDEAIAKACGISRRTLATWKLRPEFQRMVNELLQRQRKKSYCLLESGARQAVSTLLNLVESGSESVRLKAAIEIIRLTKLDHANRLEIHQENTDAHDISIFLSSLKNPNGSH